MTKKKVKSRTFEEIIRDIDILGCSCDSTDYDDCNIHELTNELRLKLREK